MNSAHKEVRNLRNLANKTRRWLLSAAALTVLIALAALGSPATAFAQDSIQKAAAGQTPVGSWLYTVTIPNPPNDPIVFLGTETYSAGGGYVEADQLSFTPGFLATAGHGGWKSTGKDAFLLTYMNLTYDANGNPTGTGKVRQTTTLSGHNYSGSGDYAYYDLNGSVVASGTFTITAKRILVEAPQQ
ncbi:MAG: hypothetical protein H0X25_13100 [Acidobacteriales bacterium]|nr:hypothetical protein [Terriglobales bacterium]